MTHKKLPAALPSVEQQRGVVLIVVLMVILLLAIAAAIAVRSSQTSLGLTTTAQINQLLFQSSDVPLKLLEREAKNPDRLAELTSENGPIGYLSIKGEQFDGAEYVLCYQPMLRSTLYSNNSSEDKHMVIVKNSNGSIGYKKNSDGYCDPKGTNMHTSKRETVLTQISMTRPTVNDTLIDDIDVRTDETETTVDGKKTVTKTVEKTHTSTPFAGATGSDMSSVNSTDDVAIRAYVTSVMTTLTDRDAIQECMQKPIGGLIDNGNADYQGQMQCLNDSRTPYDVQVQDYMYINQATAAP